MNNLKYPLQLFIKNKCQESKKAERFFKERNIPFHRINLNEKNLSPKELQAILNKIGEKEVIDKQHPTFKKRLNYMVFDTSDLLLEDSTLMKTPVIRYGKYVSIGIDHTIWKNWNSEE